MSSRPKSPAEVLKRRIVESGPVNIADYMQACLSDPAFGYYRGRDPFGSEGDFVTAPEISQIFGELIGLWCVEAWRAMGRPERLRLIELGPGRGTLMADALRAARLVPAFLAAIRLHLVETGPALRRRQAETLAGSGVEPVWHAAPAEIPDGPAIVLANEFLDALPVRQFVWRAGAWRERCVGVDATGALAFCLSDEALEDPSLLPTRVRGGAAEGAIAEARPAAGVLIRDLGLRAARHPTLALFIDYGHTESAVGDTFQAVRRHRYADPLRDIGAVDVTAHVDFAALAVAAAESGLKAWGPMTQSDFLLGLGLAERCAQLIGGKTREVAETVSAGAARLVDPEAMGTLFKVVALGAPDLPAPPPFAAPCAPHPSNGKAGYSA